MKPRLDTYAVLGPIVFYFPFLLLLMLILLSFFCQPMAEDLAIRYYDHQKGLVPFISEFYNNESSRFISFSLLFLILNGEFIISHYYLIPIILFLLFYLVTLNFISTANKYLLKGKGNMINKLWISAVSVVCFVAIAFDPATIFYWISGSITYLPSFFLFLMLSGQLIKVYFEGTATFADFGICLLYTFCITGCNEIAICFLCSFLFMNLWAYYNVTQKLHPLLITLMIGLIIFLMVLILPAGSGKRAVHGNENPRTLMQSLFVSGVYTLRTFFAVISEPFTWLMGLIAWIIAERVPLNAKVTLKRTRLGLMAWVSVSILTSFFLYLLVVLLSGELLPPRANSLISFFLLFFMITGVICSAIQKQSNYRAYSLIRFSTVARLVLLALFCTNSLFLKSLENLYTGPVYNNIMAARKRAAKEHPDIVQFEDYRKDFRDKLSASKLDRLFSGLKDRISPYPKLIYYMDPLEDTSMYIHYYADYLRVDYIIFNGKSYPRLGLHTVIK